MYSDKLRPALLIFVLAFSSVLGLLAGAEDMRFQEALLDAGGIASWSPNGTMIATSSGKDILTVNSFDGKILERFVGHASTISSVRWSSNGTRLVSGAADKTVRIWDVVSGKDILTINTQDAVRSVAWQPGGELVAAAQGNIVTVWDVRDGSKTANFEENVTAIRSVAWSPDGQRLAATGARNFAMIHNMVNGTRSLKLSGLTGDVRSLAWSPDGSRLVTGDDKSVRVWNAWSGALAKTLVSSADARYAHAVAWSPDGDRIATCLEPFRTAIWNSSSGKVIQTIAWYGENLDFSPDGNRLAIGEGETVTIYGSTSGLHLETLTGHGGSVQSLSWSPDGESLATASADSTVKTWDVSTGTELATFRGHTGAVRSVRWSPDGSRVASCGDAGGILIWDPLSLTEMETLDGKYPIAWSPDGKLLASACPQNGSVLVWDIEHGGLLEELNAPIGPIRFIAWSPDGRKLASSSYDGSSQVAVSLWNAQDWTELGNLSEKDRLTESPISWSPDGKMLALPVSNYDISIVDANDLAVLNKVGYPPFAKTVSWCPDGKTIAYSLLYEVFLWDSSMSGPYLSFGQPGQGTIINAMAWSPLGTVLATGCEDGRVVLWGPLGEVPQLHLSLSAPAEKYWPGDRAVLTLKVTDGEGTPVTGALLALSPSGGELSPVTEAGEGTYCATFTAPEVRSNTTIIITAWAKKAGFARAGGAISLGVIQNHAPTILSVSFTNGTVGNSSVALWLNANAVDPDGDPLWYDWKENDRTLGVGPGLSESFVPGQHQVILSVSDGHQGTAQTLSFTVTLPPEEPAAPAAIPPPVVGASVTVTAALGFGVFFAAAAEPSKYKLLTLLFIPLYSRISKDAALDHETRGMIRGAIIADPGIHYSEIIRRLDLRNGTAAYHLQTLEREGLIKSRNDGRFRRFYPAEMKFIGSHVRPTKLQKIILETIQEKEGMSQIEIAKTLDISYAIVHREIKRMSMIGMIRLQRYGISMKCYLAEEWQARLKQEKEEAAGNPVPDVDAIDG